MKTHPLAVAQATRFIDQMTGESLHEKRILSLTNAVVGVIHAVSASIHAIGTGLAVASGLNPKHALKQVDRLLSNRALDVWALFVEWVPHVLGAQREIVVALDWTEFDADGHATIALYLVTRHGRATPLIWRTVPERQLKGQRNAAEDSVLLRLREVLPPCVTVTALADRGFGDQKLYELLTDLGFHFIVRFRGNVIVHSATGEADLASAWCPRTGGSGRYAARRSRRTATSSTRWSA